MITARDLVGKILVTSLDGAITVGRIVETEAYNGINDRASHAYNSRRTKRTEILYSDGGIVYVYLCYGIHHLFNVVTNKKDIPHAVLIRAVEPMIGIEEMMKRCGKNKFDNTLTKGPGNVSKALGITTLNSGCSLLGDAIFIADDKIEIEGYIESSVRIGISYAKEDALLPYRFFVGGNAFVSGNRGKNPGNNFSTSK